MEEQEQNKLMRTYEILDRRHIHDEGLLIRRMANFLLVNSFLVVAFATFVTREEKFRYFSLAFPFIGIALGIIFLFLFRMQLLTADLWLNTEKEIEDRAVFPVSRDEKSLAPNQRHDIMTQEKKWMQPTWACAPTVLVAIMLGMWVFFLVRLFLN